MVMVEILTFSSCGCLTPIVEDWVVFAEDDIRLHLYPKSQGTEANVGGRRGWETLGNVTPVTQPGRQQPSSSMGDGRRIE